MSELSPVYSEYERISSLFRRLNEAVILTQQLSLGLRIPNQRDQSKIQRDLERALQELGEERVTANTLTFADILDQLQKDDVEISEETLNNIKQRVKRGLKSLTNQDIEIIEKVTDVLDSKSELLFRRIQK